jgi:hypothetical protein
MASMAVPSALLLFLLLLLRRVLRLFLRATIDARLCSSPRCAVERLAAAVVIAQSPADNKTCTAGVSTGTAVLHGGCYNISKQQMYIAVSRVAPGATQCVEAAEIS